jgi:hypothetical protein
MIKCVFVSAPRTSIATSDQTAGWRQEALLLNKRLKYQSSLSACRSPAITRTTHLSSLLDRQRHVSHTYRHTYSPHTRYRASCSPCRPDDHGNSIPSTIHATCRHHRRITFPSPEKPALYRAWLWQGRYSYMFALFCLLLLETTHTP